MSEAYIEMRLTVMTVRATPEAAIAAAQSLQHTLAAESWRITNTANVELRMELEHQS